MKRFFIFAVAVCFVLGLAGGAMAVSSGKKVEFDSKQGKVVFDGKAHADAGLKCNACHPSLFKMKKDGDKMTMDDMKAGKFCGTCHDGTKAFAVKECAKCHKK